MIDEMEEEVVEAKRKADEAVRKADEAEVHVKASDLTSDEEEEEAAE